MMCENCGKEFEPDKFNGHKQKFCCKKCYHKKYRQENGEELREKQRASYHKNKKKNKGKRKEYFKKRFQRPKVKARARELQRSPKRNAYIRKYTKNRMETDPKFRLLCRLRKRVKAAITKFSETGKIMTARKYRINYEAIIEHLKPFPEDILNYEIDHIKLLCSFDFNNPEEIKKAFAPENHQWLTVKEHLKKTGEEHSEGWRKF